MNMTNLRRFALFVFVCGALCSGSRDERVSAQKDTTVTAVVLKADDGRPTGKCPLAVKFNGTVTADRAGVVTYTFTRSDGATGPSYALTFDKAGTMPVSTEWTLGDASVLPHYEGWVAIRIVSPTAMESSHDTGSFVLNCSGAPSKGIH